MPQRNSKLSLQYYDRPKALPVTTENQKISAASSACGFVLVARASRFSAKQPQLDLRSCRNVISTAFVRSSTSSVISTIAAPALRPPQYLAGCEPGFILVIRVRRSKDSRKFILTLGRLIEYSHFCAKSVGALPKNLLSSRRETANDGFARTT